MDETTSLAGAIDTHAHLNHPRLFRRISELLARAYAVGVRMMIVVGYDLESSERAVHLAEKHFGLWASVGIHPHEAGGADGNAMEQLRKLAASGSVVAIGETGLDFHRDLSPREVQEDCFRRHLALAAELRLPVIVHCRLAHERVMALLWESAQSEAPVIWHCFDGTKEQAEQALGLGAYLGFTGLVTYPQSAELRRVAAIVPAEALLIETDSPHLAPEPRRKRDNEPANLPLIAKHLGQLRGLDSEQVMSLATANARAVFNI